MPDDLTENISIYFHFNWNTILNANIYLKEILKFCTITKKEKKRIILMFAQANKKRGSKVQD